MKVNLLSFLLSIIIFSLIVIFVVVFYVYPSYVVIIAAVLSGLFMILLSFGLIFVAVREFLLEYIIYLEEEVK